MKKYIISLLIILSATGSVVQAQELLMDSLRGKWNMKEQYNDQKRIDTKGTIEFLEDGKFVSQGSYFGSAEGLYRTDETKGTISIEINGLTSEWSATVRNHVLRMTRAKKRNTPDIVLVFLSEQGETNSGSR